jgi:hypothetical protein
MGFFNWITEGTRRAIVRGIEQAAAEINEGEGNVDITIRLPSFREPLRLPEAEPTSNGKRRKAVTA